MTLIERLFNEPTISDLNANYLGPQVIGYRSRQGESSYETSETKRILEDGTVLDLTKLVYRTMLLKEKHQGILNKIMQQNQITDELFSRMTDEAIEYAKMNLERDRPYTNPVAALSFSRLSAFLDEADLVTDIRAMPTLEAITNTRNSSPYSEHNFSIDKDYKRIPNPKINIEHIEGFHRIVQNNKLWSNTFPAMKNIYMGAIGNAILELSTTSPDPTIQPKIDLLSKLIEYNSSYDVAEKIIESLRTKRGEEALKIASQDKKYKTFVQYIFNSLSKGKIVGWGHVKIC